jgi:hypothetical protein
MDKLEYLDLRPFEVRSSPARLAMLFSPEKEYRG